LYLAILTSGLVLALTIVARKEILEIFKEVTKNKYKLSVLEYIYTILCVFLFITLGSVKPVNLDMQIYHLQVIRWQTEYGTVPGIGNLFPRFGHGSNWFNLISFFQLPFLKYDNFSYVNISFVSWFFTWLLFKCKYHLGKSDNRGNKLLSLYYFIFFIFFMFDWQLNRDAANSTNYDFEVTAFIIMSLSYFVEEAIIPKSKAQFSPILMLFALGVISFKFTAIFLLLLILYYLISHNKLSRWLLTGIAGIVIILPGFIRNYITTGYPLFPYPLSIASPDWKIPEAFAAGYYQFVSDYNHFFNYWMFIGKVPDSPLNWLPYWYKGILVQHKAVLILALSSFLLLFIKPVKEINYRTLRPVIIIVLLMIAGWFFSAPDPARFGYGFLLPAAFLPVSMIVHRFFNKRVYIFLFIPLIIGVSIYTYGKIEILLKSPVHFIYPMVTDKPPYQTITKNSIEIHVPEIINDGWDHRCFNTILPCLPGDNPYIEPRGKSLSDGFRMHTPLDSNFLRKYFY